MYPNYKKKYGVVDWVNLVTSIDATIAKTSVNSRHNISEEVSGVIRKVGIPCIKVLHIFFKIIGKPT